jgi:hypothetical protein
MAVLDIRLLLAGLMLGVMPASSNYSLNSYGFGSGGTGNSTSANYGLNATAGEQAGSTSSTNYNLGAGEKYLKQANVPTITLVNSARWYNKLLATIGPENNPSDALFSIEISSDNFATTQYVKSDHTVGSVKTFADYLTYAAWGGSSGSYIIGLTPGLTYVAKASAYRGNYTESGYGPSSSAATSPPLLTFDIDVAPTDTSTNPPYQVNIGDLLPASIVDSTDRVWTTLDTNAESGGIVYLSGKNGGLKSLTANYTIASASGDLAGQAEGFGAQVASTGQSSGGPLNPTALYSGSAQIIGVADSQIRAIFTAANPIISGRGSFILKAKSAALTPSSADYTEIMTVIASASY